MPPSVERRPQFVVPLQGSQVLSDPSSQRVASLSPHATPVAVPGARGAALAASPPFFHTSSSPRLPLRHAIALASAVAMLGWGVPAAHAQDGAGGCSAAPGATCTGGAPGAPNGGAGGNASDANGTGGSGGGGGGVDASGTAGNGGAGGAGGTNAGGGGNGGDGTAGSGAAIFPGGAGGTGGTGGSANATGPTANGAGGGGGGAGGTGAVLTAGGTNTQTVSGGNGGNGGGGGGMDATGSGGGGNGGGGGEGGAGVVLTTSGESTNNGAVVGGNGGSGGGGGGYGNAGQQGVGHANNLIAGNGGNGGAGGDAVVSQQGGTFTNNAGATVTGGNGGNGGGSGSVSAAAGVTPYGGSGGDAGAGGHGATVSGGSTVNNSGTITGGNGGNGENGGFALATSGTAAVAGSGGLGGAGGIGVLVNGSGTVLNQQTGTIRGGNGGTGGGGNAQSQVGAGGAITGGVGADGGAGGDGVKLDGGGIVINSGQILGGAGNRGGGAGNSTGPGVGGEAAAGGNGVSLNSGNVFNTATGRIVGGTGGDDSAGGGGSGGLGGDGILLSGNGTVTNSGAVIGGDGGNGGNGANTSGGSGSEGGAGIRIGGTGTVNIVSGGTAKGGAGGTGGGAGNAASAGGNGGVGGAGLIVTDGGTVSNGGTITGGDGNRGGGGGASSVGGTGGAGGAGVLVTNNGGRILNTGSIAGGTGGGTSTGGTAGAEGAGGVGVQGQNITVENSGTISGGLSGSGVQSDAVLFTAGTNSLELRAGSVINGTVNANTGTNTLILGGTQNAAFDTSLIGPSAQYQGFGAYHKTGTSVWTLNNTTTALTPWTLFDGTLVVSQDGSLGAPAGTLTFNGGTLQLGASFDLAAGRPVVLDTNGGTIDTQAFNTTITQGITGTGALTKLGSGMLLLNGNNSYSGATNVNAGTLAVGAPTSPTAALSGGGTVTVASGATLGGYGSVTGDVQNSGTLAAANAIAAFAAGSAGNFTVQGDVVNAGLLLLAGSSVGNTFTVAGNYVGQNATATLSTQLGSDNSPTDRIVINGGSATGSTVLKIVNAGGTGAQTYADGIQVVLATNGATTATSAFSGGSVSAGAYTYYLYRGGVNAGTENNWYLRSRTPDTTTPPPLVVDPIVPIPPTTDPGTPIYRPEVPVYGAIPSLARELAVQQIGTFHDRLGGQPLLSADGSLRAGWGRVWGDRLSQDLSGGVNPSFKGTIAGFQVGKDLYSALTESGHRNHYGLFAGYARASGDVKGFALATQNLSAGSLTMNAFSLGGYWTHLTPSGAYADTVLMGTTSSVDPSSLVGNTASTRANALTASVEGGVPFVLSQDTTLEPQAQLIYQYTHINDLTDPASRVTFSSANELIGRLGLRLQSQFQSRGVDWKPFLRLDVLRYFGGSDSVTYAGQDRFTTKVGSTQAHLGGGIYAQVNRNTSVYLTAGYWFNLGGDRRRTVQGNAGVRLTW